MIRSVRRLRFGPSIGRTLLAVTAGAVLAGAAARSHVSGTLRAQAPAALVDLQSTAELRAQFNTDRGNTRLVLLLSPT